MTETPLTLLFCGCVVDFANLRVSDCEGIMIVECCFCGATLWLEDLARWSVANEREISMYMLNAVHSVLPLIQYRDEALEVLEICACGYPIVRKMKRKDERYHLRVSERDTVRLYN